MEAGQLIQSIVIPTRPMARDSGLNSRMHWRQRNRINNHTKTLIHFLLAASEIERPLQGKATVTFRVSQHIGPLPDDDNQRGMCKAGRDAVASYFQVDDGPKGPITWVYEWERGPTDRTEIEIERE